MYDELTKAKKTEWMEAMGLEGFASAVEKFHEDSVWWPVYAISAFIGLAVPAFLLAVALGLKDTQRKIQGAFFNLLGKKWATFTDTIYARQEGKILPRRQRVTDVNENERAAGGGMASIPADANFDALRGQLTSLNPELQKFNNHAPDFKRNLRGMPSLAKATKIADAVKKLGEAVDPTQTPLIAKALGKINEGVTYSDPKKTTAFAKAIGKLKLAMNDFDPTQVPTAAALGPAAQKAGELAQHTTTLTRHMRGFADAVRDLNTQMNPA
ncbi:hypothetical protein [Streptomyces sp. SS]|uniref:hypothetical protein n=1 Tax=Streptomyces sp. SS TaxID=260742 RepID=UPI0002EBDFCE|nr:hypothetical protein [Streptomyces sp. SS]